jgi:hypothetical protein
MALWSKSHTMPHQRADYQPQSRVDFRASSQCETGIERRASWCDRG